MDLPQWTLEPLEKESPTFEKATVNAKEKEEEVTTREVSKLKDKDAATARARTKERLDNSPMDRTEDHRKANIPKVRTARHPAKERTNKFGATDVADMATMQETATRESTTFSRMTITMSMGHIQLNSGMTNHSNTTHNGGVQTKRL